MEKLEHIPEFTSSPELIARLYQYGIQKNYEAGKTILNENAHIRSIPIVTKGTLKVIRTEEDGREILLYYIKAGESCIMSFLGGLHNETSKVKAEVEENWNLTNTKSNNSSPEFLSSLFSNLFYIIGSANSSIALNTKWFKNRTNRLCLSGVGVRRLKHDFALSVDCG